MANLTPKWYARRVAGLAPGGPGAARLPGWDLAASLVVLALLAVVIVAGGGVYLLTRSSGTSATPPVHTTPAQAMTLGLQDDALLTSAEPLAVPTVKALAPKLIRYNIVWSDIAPTKPADAGNPADPAYVWTNADKIVALASDAPGVPAVHDRRRAEVGQRRRDTRARPDRSRRLRDILRRRREALPDRRALHHLERAEPRAVPAAAGHGRQRRAERARRPREGVHPRHPRKQPARARRDRPDREPREARAASRRSRSSPAYRAAGGPRPDGIALNPYLEGQAPLFVPTERPADGAVTVRNLDWLEGALKHAYGKHDADLADRVRRAYGAARHEHRPGDAAAPDGIELVRAHYPYVPLLIWFLLRDQGPHDYWRSGLVDTAWHRKPAFAVFRSLS